MSRRPGRALAHFRHFKLQTFGLQLIRASVQIKIRHRIYELEHLARNLPFKHYPSSDHKHLDYKIKRFTRIQ
jgi:hypothetical protein